MFATPLKARAIGAAAVLSSLLFAPSGHAAETLKLDTSVPANSQFAPAAAVASSPLATGTDYVITVSGTATIWGGPTATTSFCGLPEANVVENSPGRPSRSGSWDAATIFAAPSGAIITPLGPCGSTAGTVALPISTSTTASGFVLSQGGPYVRPMPVGGNRTAPRADHTYSYQLSGNGAPVGFKFIDSPVDDNTGVFTIVVRTAAECAAINCLGTATPQSDAAAAPVVNADPGTVSVAGTRSCRLDRVLSVRLSVKAGVRVSKAVYYINGKKLRVVTGKKNYIRSTKTFRAQKFRSLPDGVLKLKIVVTSNKGQKTQVERSIVRCSPRIKARGVSFK